MAAKVLFKKSFKGIGYTVIQESPNVYNVKIGDRNTGLIISFFMVNEGKIDKVVRNVVIQTKKYIKDGVISKAEKVKLEKFTNDFLKKEGVNVRTVTPITDQKDIKPGCVIMPRDVDIVATEDILIINSVNDKQCNCFMLNEPVKAGEPAFANKTISISDVISGYLIIDYISEEIKEYNNYKKQVAAMEKFFVTTIKSITTDINETSNSIDDHIEDLITNAILESGYNGLLKERMISFIEEKGK